MYAYSTETQTGAGWTASAVAGERQLLLVQPDGREREALHDYLADHGYVVHLAAQQREIDAVLQMAGIDLILLQAGPAADMGLELCRQLGGPGAPGLIVSGAFDATDRILALELGADDYLAAPFNPRELLARVKAVLRRAVEPRRPTPHPGHRCFLGFRFDFGSPLLRRLDGSAPLTLTPGEFALLSAFVANPGRVMSRDELLEMARGDAEDVFDRVIDVQVSRLRQKLAPFAEDPPIRTHRHAGYQFVAEISS